MNSIARTILEQLGGREFVTMTGAKGMAPTNKGLAFLLPDDPDFVKDGINFVRISLNGMDLYDVEFCQYKDEKLTMIHYDEDLYNDQLQEIFTSRTGLDTRMPRIVFMQGGSR